MDGFNENVTLVTLRWEHHINPMFSSHIRNKFVVMFDILKYTKNFLSGSYTDGKANREN